MFRLKEPSTNIIYTGNIILYTGINALNLKRKISIHFLVPLIYMTVIIILGVYLQLSLLFYIVIGITVEA